MLPHKSFVIVRFDSGMASIAGMATSKTEAEGVAEQLVTKEPLKNFYVFKAISAVSACQFKWEHFDNGR